MIDLSSLNPEQKEAVKTIEGPVCVIAGAGSGKTKALTLRIANMVEKGIRPQNILAITFTNKAAREMKDRVNKVINNKAISDEIFISTFHSFCSRLLRNYVHELKYLKQGFSIIDSDDQKDLVKTAILNLNLDPDKFQPRAVASFISDCKNNLIKWSDLDETMTNPNFINCYREYQESLAYYNRCDFDDLLCYTVDLLKEKPNILAGLQNRYKYILVDEYQDTNPAQYVLTTLLAHTNRNLFVVGDVDQAIYGFRGSDYKNILNFQKDYPEAKIIKLEQNYRSTDIILEAANEVIKNNSHRIPKNLRTTKRSDSPIIMCETNSAIEEALWVLQKVKYEHDVRFRKYKDISILVRNNNLTHAFEDVFVSRGIPYNVVGARKFYDRKEIKDALAYFKVRMNPNDLISLKRIINYPKRDIGEKSYANIVNYCKENNLDILSAIDRLVETGDINLVLSRKKGQEALIEFRKQMDNFSDEDKSIPFANRLYNFLDGFGIFKELNNAEARPEDREINETRKENIISLITSSQYYMENDNEKTLENYLDYISLISDADTIKEKEDKVTIMTCHASKGLEFPVVFIVGFEEEIFPSWQAIREEDTGNGEGIEEERRLCYVAITRAKEQLYISYSTLRKTFNNISYHTPSRFLDEIPEDLLFEEEYHQ